MQVVYSYKMVGKILAEIKFVTHLNKKSVVYVTCDCSANIIHMRQKNTARTR